MPSFAGWPLQKAIAARLAAHASTSSYTVSDNQAADPPFIKLGRMGGRGHYSTQTVGSDARATLHVWAYDGKTVQEMMEDVCAALEGVTLDLSADGHQMIGQMMLAASDVLDETDTVTGVEQRHGILEFSVMTQYTG